MNLLGQVAGVASTEFGLSRMIWAAVNVAYDGEVKNLRSAWQYRELTQVKFADGNHGWQASRLVHWSSLCARPPEFYLDEIFGKDHTIVRLH